MTDATLYGIKTCDTVKKARAWLDAAGVDHAFYDYKTRGVPEAALQGWVRKLGWQALLNRAGTTFRKLSDADKTELDSGRAFALMRTHPSAIKRPVLERGDLLLVGFDADAYAKAFTG